MGEKVSLSASRINTACQCTWRYYCNYILKLPQERKDYFILGSLSHLVLECLQRPKHKDKYDIIIRNNDIYSCLSVKRLVEKHIKWSDGLLNGREDDINNFVLTGLNFDFFCEGCVQLLDPELEFNIENDKYKIRGYIDKSAIYSSFALVGDYKTSKRKPSESDKEWNVQALMYAFVLREKFGRFDKYRVDFIYLKFDKDPLYRCEYTNEELDFFEHYLDHVSKYLSNFSINNAMDVIPKGTYKQPMLCGALRGDLKPDGSEKHICDCKYGFEYYALFRDGKVVKTSFTKDGLIRESGFIKKMKYGGCPAWKNEV